MKAVVGIAHWCLVLVVVGATGCRPDAPAQPNVLLISIDTTRADHCSVLGYGRDTTPRLRKLAAEGASFEKAYAPLPTTLPSHATMFTGRYPVSHGVVGNGVKLEESHQTLAERLRVAGYRTAAVVSALVLHRRFGLAQGFEYYEDDFPHAEAHPRSSIRENWKGEKIEAAFTRQGNHTTRRALAWLNGSRDRAAPFFLFVHYFDPHSLFQPPEPYASRFAQPSHSTHLEIEIDRYDAMIAFADAMIGRLLDGLDELGVAQDTIVVVTADHGEGLMEHGYFAHGAHLYEEAVRVPLVVRWPRRVRAGVVFREAVELVDLAPTLLEFAGIDEALAGSQGRSLAQALRTGGGLDSERPVFLHRRDYEERFVGRTTWVKGKKFAIRIGRWKYIEGLDEGTRELFDLESDPGETVNLSAQQPERVAELSTLISEWRVAHTSTQRAVGVATEADQRALKALGYVQ